MKTVRFWEWNSKHSELQQDPPTAKENAQLLCKQYFPHLYLILNYANWKTAPADPITQLIYLGRLILFALGGETGNGSRDLFDAIPLKLQ